MVVMSSSASASLAPESSMLVTSALAVIHRCCKRTQDCLVLFVELGTALLLSEVEVAVDLFPDADRHSQERAHGRVACREAGGQGVLAEIRDPHRPRVGDERAEEPTALRPVMDRRDLFLAEANRYELRKP